MYSQSPRLHRRSHFGLHQSIRVARHRHVRCSKNHQVSEVEPMCHSAQSNTFEFEWQPDTKEGADVAPGDVTYILSLFAHNKKSPDGEVGRYSRALVLKRK